MKEGHEGRRLSVLIWTGSTWDDDSWIGYRGVFYRRKHKSLLTIVEVLQQVLLTREVQFDLDVDRQRHTLAVLQWQVRRSLFQLPAEKLPEHFLCSHTQNQEGKKKQYERNNSK